MSESIGPTIEIAKRPTPATALAVILTIMGFIELVALVVAVILAMRPGDSQQILGSTVSDAVWIFAAFASGVLALIYFWLAGAVRSGSPMASALVNVFAVINIVLAVLTTVLGTGWFGLLLNIVILALNNLRTTKSWYAAG